MYLYKSRHGIYYYRRNGRKRSLNTRKKSDAMLALSRMLTMEHAGAKITIDGKSTAVEMAIAQGIIATKITDKKLSQVLKLFYQEKTSDNSWTEKTAGENKRIITHFIQAVGDIVSSQIGYEHLNNYKQSLISSDKATQTVNKYLSRLGTFCTWCERHGYMGKNYAAGMQLKRTTSEYEDRDRYTLDEVQRIFNALNVDDKKPHRYWLPVLGYYTGARVNELCQLYCSDVYHGVIDINKNTPDKRLKNRPSKRIIPIHPELIRLGFEDFCNREGRVFPELSYSRDGYSKNVWRWYKDLILSLGIEPTFHSFRHTFTDELKQALVNPTVIDEYTGHAVKGESMGRYGKRFNIEVLKEAVDKIPTIKVAKLL